MEESKSSEEPTSSCSNVSVAEVLLGAPPLEALTRATLAEPVTEDLNDQLKSILSRPWKFRESKSSPVILGKLFFERETS